MAVRKAGGFYSKFKSGLEYVIGDFLRARERRFGYITRYEPERLKYQLEGTYTPDFVITFSDGRKIYIETKGYMDNDARRKMVAVKRGNPDLDIRMVFQKDNLTRKDGTLRYMTWAQKYGFKCALKTIPDEWLQPPKEEVDEQNDTNSS